MKTTIELPDDLLIAAKKTGHRDGDRVPIRAWRPAGPAVAGHLLWPYNMPMAKMTIRSTFALDPETVKTLERISRKWGVSKSEALRRAVRSAAPEGVGAAVEPLAALDALQKAMKLSPAKAGRWIREIRRERRSIGRLAK